MNQAATQKIGTMWGKSYVVTPGGIMVPPESPITAPEQLAGQEIAVGYHSGSHYTTIQALEPLPVARADQAALRRLDLGAGRYRGRPRPAGGQRLGPVVPGAGAARLPQGRRCVVHDRIHVPGRRRSGRRREIHERHEARADGTRLRAGEVSALLLNEIPDRYKSKVDVRRFSTAWEAASAAHAPTPEQEQANEAVLALIALGYKQADAHKAVHDLQQKGETKSAEELVKLVLKKMAAGRCQL